MSRLFPDRARTAVTLPQRTAGASGSTRDLILDRAAKLFRTHGYENTSLALIAESINLTATAIYRHFPSKYDLFARSVEKLQLDFDAQMESIPREGTPTERLRAITIAHCLHQVRRTVAVTGTNQVMTFGQLAVHLAEPERSVVLNLQGKHLERIKETIRDGVRTGEFFVANVTVAAFAVIALPENLVLWFHQDGALSDEAVAEMLADLVIGIVR
ncbi:MAG: TetR family transcriptional regulator [Rhodoglobus sp.]|jgi:AcrR family transcriptional regulator|nr:TetR family transcriptional regulator [Rhodoglobus sp.]